MPHISIKDVPDAWAEALRQRAARNHRSLQGELMALLEQAVQEVGARPSPGRPAMPANQLPARRGWKTIEQVSAELRARHPLPIADQLSSLALIREDRDSR
jgi:plasmid stability protein